MGVMASEGDQEHQPTTARVRIDHALATVADDIALVEVDGRLLHVGDGIRRMLGYDAEEWRSLTLPALLDPAHLGDVMEAWRRAVGAPSQDVAIIVRLRDADGTWRDIDLSFRSMLDRPEVAAVAVVAREVTKWRRRERAAAVREAVLELIARGAPLADVLDACVDLVDGAPGNGQAWITLVDSGRPELRAGHFPPELVVWWRENEGRAPTTADQAIATGRPALVEDYTVHADPEVSRVAVAIEALAAWSHPICIEGRPDPIGALTTVFDRPHLPTPDQVHNVEEACRLAALAIERDARSGAVEPSPDRAPSLPNRAAVIDHLDRAVARRIHGGPALAVLLCDLDRFKTINDSLGHRRGDELLVAVEQRLSGAVRPHGTVTRFGGDEFVVLLDDVSTEHHPLDVASNMVAALRDPFELPSGVQVHLTASIGVVSGDADADADADAWLRDADAAMYEAKAKGRNRISLFDPAMRLAALARFDVETDLRYALANDQFVVHYQPTIDLRTGRIVGAEALVRWEHPRRGLIPPLEFVTVAEDLGLIGEVGAQVLDASLAAMARIRARRHRRFTLGVNLSTHQLADDALAESVRAACDRWDWPRDDLLLEITESALAETESTAELLATISELGVSLAIDDFGTGHSSLDRLGRMPVDQLKIDRSFVSALDGEDERLMRLVDAVVDIAGALELSTTAEGVETDAQLAYLRAAGCTFAQGYLFAKPMPLDDFAAMLEADPRW